MQFSSLLFVLLLVMCSGQLTSASIATIACDTVAENLVKPFGSVSVHPTLVKHGWRGPPKQLEPGPPGPKDERALPKSARVSLGKPLSSLNAEEAGRKMSSSSLLSPPDSNSKNARIQPGQLLPNELLNGLTVALPLASHSAFTAAQATPEPTNKLMFMGDADDARNWCRVLLLGEQPDKLPNEQPEQQYQNSLKEFQSTMEELSSSYASMLQPRRSNQRRL